MNKALRDNRRRKQRRKEEPGYADKLRRQMREWHAKQMRENPEYRQARILRKREYRRRKRVAAPDYVEREMEKVIAQVDRILKHIARYKAKEQRLAITQKPGYKAQQLEIALQSQRRLTRELSDGYIRRKLVRIIQVDRSAITSELVCLHRANIALKREIRKGK